VHPLDRGARLGDQRSHQLAIRIFPGHLEKVVPEIVGGVRGHGGAGLVAIARLVEETSQVADPLMREAEPPSRERTVPALLGLRRLFEDDDPRSPVAGGKGSTERGVPSADYYDIALQTAVLGLFHRFLTPSRDNCYSIMYAYL